MTGTGPSPLGAAWQVAQYLFLFALVLGLAYLFSRSLRRLVPFTRSRHLRLLDQLHLGPSRSFYLLAVAGKVVLVAMGEGGVSTVTTLDDPDLVASLLEQADQPSYGAAGPSVPFRRSFAALLAQVQRDPVLGGAPDADGASAPGRAPAPEATLRRQVERLRRLAERTEG